MTEKSPRQSTRQHQLLQRTKLCGLLSMFMLSTVLVGCGQGIKVDDSDVVYAGLTDFQSALDDVDTRKENHIVVVDPRAVSQYRAGHLATALNIQLAETVADDFRIRKAKVIYVYGEYSSDPLAMVMCKKLLSLGYKEVRLYEGGLEEWRAANLPLVSGGGDN